MGAPAARQSSRGGLLTRRRLAAPLPAAQAVVFCNRREAAEALAGRLAEEGYPAAFLSAQKQQLERMDALNALRDFRWVYGCMILCAGGKLEVRAWVWHKELSLWSPGLTGLLAPLLPCCSRTGYGWRCALTWSPEAWIWTRSTW